MAHRWWKSGHLKPGEEINERGSTLRYDQQAGQFKMVVNGFGSVVTLVVTMVFGTTKFTEGAWIIILLTPDPGGDLLGIHVHYRRLAKQLSLEHYGAPTAASRHRVIVAMAASIAAPSRRCVTPRILSDDITAVHVSIDPEEAERIREKWETWGDGYRLVILDFTLPVVY